MTAKEYLQQLKSFKDIIDLREKKRQQLLYKAKSIQSPVYGVKVREDRAIDHIPQLAATAADLEKENQEALYQYILYQNHVINQIQLLDDPIEMQILFGRYVEFKLLKDVAKETKIDYAYIRQRHGKALQHFSEANPTLEPFDF